MRCPVDIEVKPVEIVKRKNKRWLDAYEPFKTPRCHRLQNKLARTAKRTKALAILGGKCVKCSFADIRALQIDHINGDGNQERREGKNWFHLLNDINANGGQGKYQLLCANCNFIKKYENREYSFPGPDFEPTTIQ